MKKPIVLLISWLIYSVSYCQTNINYSSFDAWRQNSSTKKMEHIKSIYESGYIEIDNKKATAIIHNSKTNQKELFQFTPFRKVANGHFIGFGRVDRQQMLTFIPEDRLLLLKVNDIVVMQFSLKQSDIIRLKKEFMSIIREVNIKENKIDSSFSLDFLDSKFNGAGSVSSKNKVDLLSPKRTPYALTVASQGDRVDIYKVKKQIVKGYTTKSYDVTDMFLALRYEDDTHALEEVQIIHKSLNKTEKYYVTSSERSIADDDYYGQVYYTIKNVSDNKYSKIMLTLDLNNEFIRILPNNINKTYTYTLNHYQTVYR